MSFPFTKLVDLQILAGGWLLGLTGWTLGFLNWPTKVPLAIGIPLFLVDAYFLYASWSESNHREIGDSHVWLGILFPLCFLSTLGKPDTTMETIGLICGAIGGLLTIVGGFSLYRKHQGRQAPILEAYFRPRTPPSEPPAS